MTCLNRVALALIALAMAVPALAQVELPPSPVRPDNVNPTAPTSVSGIPIDQLPPGARALGLGGAFSAVADDATAAEANPAGQVQLLEPEFSLHLRHSDNDLDFYDAEQRNPLPFTGQAPNPINNFSDSSTNVSFASFVYPIDNFVVSAFYTNNADLSALAAPTTFADEIFVDTYTSRQQLGGELDGYGLSVAYRINDRLSIGFTAKRNEISLSSFDQTQIDNFRDFEFIFNQARPDISAEEFASVINDSFLIDSQIEDDDSAMSYSMGLLMKPTDKWSLALTYRIGAEFDIVSDAVFTQSIGCVGSGQARDVCDLGFRGIDLDPFNSTQITSLPANVRVPDVLTFGAAWRPSDTLLFSLDINKTSYGDLAQPRSRTLGFEFPVDGTPFGDPPTTILDVEPIEDEWTINFGAEKVFFLDSDLFNLFTVRAGAFTDEDRDGTTLLDTDDTHITAGLGLVLLDYKLQIDVAADFSDRTDNIVLSAIYKF
ncbi:MAG: outer membrane protein transport protein [Pseudomonadota bacterium]